MEKRHRGRTLSSGGEKSGILGQREDPGAGVILGENVMNSETLSILVDQL